MRKTGVLFLILFLLSPISVLAAEVTALERELAVLKTESVDQAAESLDAETDFSEILREVVTGDFDLSFSGWKEKLTEMAFGEFQLQGKLLMQLVIVVLLSAILKQLSDSFQGKSVGEMGFYLCYMVLVVVILGAFHSISDVVVERMSGINGVFAAMLPVFLALSAANGDPPQGVLMGPAIMGGSAVLSVAISQIIVPTILLAISLEMADHISEKPILG